LGRLSEAIEHHLRSDLVSPKDIIAALKMLH